MTVLARLATHAGADAALECGADRLAAADLLRGARAAANVLRAAGVVPGDRVALVAGSSSEWVLAWLGTVAAGAIAVPVNPGSSAGELAFVLGDAAPRAIVSDRADRADRASLPMGAFTPAALAAAASAATAIPVTQGADDDALLLYTSGTTGRAKGVLHRHGALLANSDALIERWRFGPSDCLMHALPLFHVHGLCVGLHTALIAGATTILLPRFDAEIVLDVLARRAATVFMGVPTMYSRLLDAAGTRAPLPALRLAACGSAPPPPGLADRFRATFGIALTERYGMTETLITLAHDPAEPASQASQAEAGSVGRPLAGVEVCLAGDGELLVRGATLLREYWNAPDFTRAAFTPDGWFRTGDVARQNADGSFTLIGRKKDFINTGGEKVAPREVEEVLLSHPGVLEACVLGIPDPEFGEAVAAAIVRKPDATVSAAELIELCRDRLASWKKPRHIEFIAALPRNPMGKVDVVSLRAQLVKPTR